MFFHTAMIRLLNKKISHEKIKLRVLLVLIMAGIFYPSFSQTKTNTELLKRSAIIQAGKKSYYMNNCK
ncbi:MAG: hypothetical protein WDO71_29360 [Bacteroidota bacterium]